jgi:L-threonylcarbamoyladenylate synthase
VNHPGSMGGRSNTERLAPDPAGVERAVQILTGGGLVAFPTETVYGLGADATNPEAVARIFAAKERPRFNPLIAHMASPEAARREGIFDQNAEALAAGFWPGPLTLVVPTASTCSIGDLARAGLDSVALRHPKHRVASDLLTRFGRPVVAPSANRSGRVSPTTAEHVLADLDGRIDAVLDDGMTSVGMESTIVACLDEAPRLLRPGGIPRGNIEAVLGRELRIGVDEAVKPRAPGMLASHYAPCAKVRLNALRLEPGEAVLLFGASKPQALENAIASRTLSGRGDLTEAAQRFFHSLRALDETGAHTIAVVPIPDEGLGEAINDRLRRAAAERR